MNASTVLLLLLVLACPLMMLFMHGGHGGRHGHNKQNHAPASSLEDLRRRRDELDREIAVREATDAAADVEPDGDAVDGPRALAGS